MAQHSGQLIEPLCYAEDCYARRTNGCFCERHARMAGQKAKQSAIPKERLMAGKA